MTVQFGPKVELVVVGDELLSGRVVDTDSAFLGRRLADVGLRPRRIIKIGDDDGAIRAALAAVVPADLVIVVGGMGPTPDDRTTAAVASFLDRRLISHAATLARTRAAFRRRGIAVPKPAERQALVVEGAELLDNPCGMVPGMLLRHQGTTIVLLPGVPAELEAIVGGGLPTRLARRLGARRQFVQTIRTFGTPESAIAQRLAPILARNRGVTCGYYPSTGGVDIVLRSADRIQLARCRAAVAGALAESVYEVGDATMEEVVGRLLRRKRLTIATAESCTGGLVGDRLTDVPGSSAYFRGGVVCYANDAKAALLGVSEATLRRYGAVSEATASQMAVGVRRLLDVRVGLAVSGIAGPGGGTRAKPVGLVYVAAQFDDRVEVEEHRFGGGRRIIKERAASAVLDLCRRMLEEV